MLDPVGFWSYGRHDDAHSDGQLSLLRAIVGRAVSLQYGAEIQLWQDVAAIPFGADWAETIERTIDQTTFFIPIVTPRFLKSINCRDEFLAFRKRMEKLGRNDLIFPVHYVSVEGMTTDETVFGNDLAILRRSQWIDFRPLFYADPKSHEVRRWAGGLAGSILKTLRKPTPMRMKSATPRAEACESPSEAPSSEEPASAPSAALVASKPAEAAPQRPLDDSKLPLQALETPNALPPVSAPWLRGRFRSLTPATPQLLHQSRLILRVPPNRDRLPP
jgi:hypothetical protein